LSRRRSAIWDAHESLPESPERIHV
jgi:hypothetical protein